MSNLNSFRSQASDPLAFVTLGGIPLRFELAWPFHPSTSGADFHVLHGKAWLLSDPDKALHAEFSANVSLTIVDALASLEPRDAEAVVINAARMAADAGRLEFKKSAKLVPLEISSRHFSFKTNQIIFAVAAGDQPRSFLEHKVYWLGYRSLRQDAKVWIADPYDCAYLNNSPEKLMAAAETLANDGLLHLEDEFASATLQLGEKTEAFETNLQNVLEQAVAKFNAAMIEK
jgi:hypothetical protein